MHIPKKIDWYLKRITARYRSLPNCYIVGAQKAGTSSLYHYLIQHSQIEKSFKKEIHYFDGGLDPSIDDYQRGKNWYKAHFSLKKTDQGSNISIDATPLYLFNPIVPKRIYQCTPNAKIIILLRDPVERAISHYFHVKRHGFEPLPFEEALAKEAERLAPCYANNNFKDPAFRLYSYQARGMYLEQIQNYLKYFNSQEILIINSDDLFVNAEVTIQKVFQFLNVDVNYRIPDLKSQNVGNNKQQISNDTRHYLQNHFSVPNQALFDYLGQSFDWQ